MLSVIWRESAVQALEDIADYISLRNPLAALKIKKQIEVSVLPLAEHPYLFRPGRVPGTREVVAHPNYIVVYAVRAAHVEVIDVLHARMQYPKVL